MEGENSVSCLGSVMEVIAVEENALSPIVSVPSPSRKVTLASAMPLNALSPIAVTLAGISIEVNAAPENADAPMETVPPRFTDARVGIVSSATKSNLPIFAKALSPMVTGRFGSVSSVIAIPLKAYSPIVSGVSPFSKVTEARELVAL